MKKLLLPLVFTCVYLSSVAQNKCATDQVMKAWLDAHPEVKANFEKRQMEADALDAAKFSKGGYQKTAAATYTIPVVFHVLHKNGSENISDNQIKDAVAILNRDYRKKNADTAVVISQFKPLIADVNFEFVLATKDPNGNCTTGITRHFTSGTDWTGNPGEFAYTWDPTKYINFYVVKTITIGSNAAGYTFLPGTHSTGDDMDAIVILHDYVGSIGTGNVGVSRALTHEVGHWFNLRHLWGSTNQPGVACGDDGVSDTPITKGWSSCPGGSPAVCNSTITENYQNYMDYSYCSHMFTTGQASRMEISITGSTSGRNNLWTNANLIATGVINPVSPCAPVADMGFPTFTLCSGKNMNFTDCSYNGTVATRFWAASGGAAIANNTAATTGIVFPTAGVQTVSLTVTNSTGTNTAVKTVTVLNGTANIGFTFNESFEPAGALPPNWSVINLTGGITWASSSNAASGVYSYWMENYGLNSNGSIDILETPSYNFASDAGAVFTFKYAYAKKDAANNDVFKVQASSDCGGTWVDIWQPSNNTLASGSGGTSNLPFFPTPAQFKTYTLTTHPGFSPFKTQNNVRIRFYFQEDATNGFGNNFYLDDINYKDTTVEINDIGINEISKSIDYKIYPNPTHGSAKIEFTLSDNAAVSYFVSDITGRVVEPVKALNLTPGTHQLNVNDNRRLSRGVYLVNFDFNGQRISRKLIVE